MLEEYFWILWRARVWIAVTSYCSGLYGLYDLETSKYWIYIISETKWSQTWGKIIEFSYSWLSGLHIDLYNLWWPFLVFLEFLILFETISKQKMSSPLKKYLSRIFGQILSKPATVHCSEDALWRNSLQKHFFTIEMHFFCKEISPKIDLVFDC